MYKVSDSECGIFPQHGLNIWVTVGSYLQRLCCACQECGDGSSSLSLDHVHNPKTAPNKIQIKRHPFWNKEMQRDGCDRSRSVQPEPEHVTAARTMGLQMHCGD